MTLITEFPDETIDGEAFRFAHTVQMEAALAAVGPGAPGTQLTWSPRR